LLSVVPSAGQVRWKKNKKERTDEYKDKRERNQFFFLEDLRGEKKKKIKNGRRDDTLRAYFKSPGIYIYTL
jgi:transposase